MSSKETFKGRMGGGGGINFYNKTPLQAAIQYGILIGLVMGIFSYLSNKKQSIIKVILTILFYGILFGAFIYVLVFIRHKFLPIPKYESYE